MGTALLVMLALATTVAAVELVRREIVVVRMGTRWWRLDAAAMGALYTSVAAVVLWAMVAAGSHPTAFGPAFLWLGVLLFLLAGERNVERS